MSEVLTARLEALARAVERSGAPADAVARLLELASVATVHAVALDLVVRERTPPRRRGSARPAEPPAALRRAA